MIYGLPMAATHQHTRTTLVETQGLGGWQPVEIYRCDECGDLIAQPIEINPSTPLYDD